METQLDISSMDKLLREAAHGHIDVIKDFILQCPEKVTDVLTIYSLLTKQNLIYCTFLLNFIFNHILKLAYFK